MAMRWSFCEAPPGVRVGRARAARLAALVLLGVAAACVSRVTRYYLPDPGNPRFDPDQATDVLENYLRVQCPERLAAKRPPSGEVAVLVLTDTSGAVTRAELTSSTGDAMLDGLFGTVAAQLRVDSLRATRTATATSRLRMGFTCGDSAAVATLQIRRPT